MRVLLPLVLLLGGCVHKVHLVSEPPGAFVFRGSERIGTAPMDLRIPIYGRPKLTMRLPGYREVSFRPPTRARGVLSFVRDALTLQWARALGRAPSDTWRVLLVPDRPSVAQEGLREAGTP